MSMFKNNKNDQLISCFELFNKGIPDEKGIDHIVTIMKEYLQMRGDDIVERQPARK